MCAAGVPETPVRATGPMFTGTWLVGALVGVDVVLVLVLVVLVLDELELDVLVALDEAPDDWDVTRTTGVPVGWVPTIGGGVTVPLPALTTVVMVLAPEPEPLPEPEPPEPEPEPPEPEPEPLEPEPPPEPEPEPVVTGVAGVLTTGVGVATTGVAGVVVTVVVPEPVVPVPVLPLPEPPVVGVELRVGCRPATGREIVPDVEWCADAWVAVPCPTCASRVLRLLATAAGTPAAPVALAD